MIRRNFVPGVVRPEHNRTILPYQYVPLQKIGTILEYAVDVIGFLDLKKWYGQPLREGV
jgi:hypothetical protein